MADEVRLIDANKLKRDVGVYCAIRAVTGKRRPCLIRYVDVDIEYRDCEQCIQDFLNEESEG